jgi:pilus assembly protein CpaB
VSRRRRALLLAGLALLLGGLAASDVASRERALREGLGPTIGVVVARTDIAAGARIARDALAVRSVPERYAPRGAVADPAARVGLRGNADVAAGPGCRPTRCWRPADRTCVHSAPLTSNGRLRSR